MLLVSGINFSSKVNQNFATSNPQTASAKLHSQPKTDCVSFGSSIPKNMEEQAKMLSEFLGEKVVNDMGWAFKSVKQYSLAELEAINNAAIGKTVALQEKIGGYTKPEQVGECVASAYDYLLKTQNDWPVFYREPNTPGGKTNFLTFALPVGQSDLVEYGYFSPSMRAHINHVVKKNKGIVTYGEQKYEIHKAFMSNGGMEDEFVGYEIGLAE